MSDDVLFVAAPYVAAASMVVWSGARYALLRRPIEPVHAHSRFAVTAQAIWRWAIGIVLLGHVLAIAFPRAILIWDRQPLRLLILEGAGLIAGIAALCGLLGSALQRLSASTRVSPTDVTATTLAIVQVISGIAVAVLYRWASSWSGVTLVPYVHSLVLGDPAVILVADMPLLVRLHVFCAFAFLACLPFTRSADLAFAFLRRHKQPMAIRVAEACAPAWRVVNTRRVKQVRLVQSMLLRHDDREN
jgi:nitrate reductase gamma subunit